MLSATRRRLLLTLPAAALAGCGVVARRTGSTASPSRPTPQQQWARTAWRYFENNTDYDTGLVAGTDRGQLFTAWNAGDGLAALLAARALDVIDERELDLRLSKALGFLANMELSGGMLPNKAYHVATGRMVNFGGQPEDIGWSAVDIGRLLLWLKIVGQRHPRFREYADQAVLRWSFCDVIDDCGALYGSSRTPAALSRYREGRLGYEQLAAAGYAAWGFETRRASALPAVEMVNILGQRVAHDARDPRTSGAQAPVLTMPYALAAMEAGGTSLAPLAGPVYAVQEERWRREHVVTARSDYQSREAPYVVLDSVFASGYAFNTIGHDGQAYEKLALVSTRAAFALAAVRPGDYAQRLLEHVRHLYDPDRGWFEGRFEAGGAPHPFITLSTNAAVLEALWFQQEQRPFLAADTQPGPFAVQSGDPFVRTNRCRPRERAACAG